MFSLPLIKQANRFTTEQQRGTTNRISKDLQAIAKKNLIYSSIISLTSVIGFVVFSVLHSVSILQNYPELSYFAEIAFYFDFAISCPLAFSLHQNWMPKKIRVFIQRMTTKDSNSSSAPPKKWKKKEEGGYFIKLSDEKSSNNPLQQQEDEKVEPYFIDDCPSYEAANKEGFFWKR
jgi:hypothetical protein